MPDKPDALDTALLREAYDAHLRTYIGVLPPGAELTRDGPLYRYTGLFGGGFITYRDLDGLRGAELDALIARQRDFFAGRGEEVEWKLYGHDEPEDLPERLVAGGFEPEERETVVVGLVEPLAAAALALPAGVRLRETTERRDLDRIVEMETTVWGKPRPTQADELAAEIAGDPESITVVLAEPEDGGPVICAGWIRYVGDTGFATLWGGSTLPEWRGRGIYKAVVGYRARQAAERGYQYLQVDASDDSRPILERLGFVVVTTTTPYIFKPVAASV